MAGELDAFRVYAVMRELGLETGDKELYNRTESVLVKETKKTFIKGVVTGVFVGIALAILMAKMV